MEGEIVELLYDTISLADAGRWNEIYQEAEKRRIKAARLTQYLWDAQIHPETEGLTKIPESFAEGLKVKSVAIGNGVTSIGDSAFQGCTGLTSVTWNAENCQAAGSYDDYIFTNCPKLTTVTIGDNVKAIPSYAFRGCKNLTSVTIGNSVTSIGYSTFAECTSLTDINIPDSITSIDDWAFFRCISLTGIVVPEGVTSIGSAVFASCIGLTSVTLGDDVTSIGSSSFSGCRSLSSITLPKRVAHIG